MAIRTRLAFERVNESISFQSTTAYAVMVSGYGTLSRSQPRIQVAVRLSSIADSPDSRVLLLAFYIIL